MVDPAGLRDMTKSSIGLSFIRLYLRVQHKTGVVCRSCKTEIPLEDVIRFVNDGCLNCGCKKLEAV